MGEGGVVVEGFGQRGQGAAQRDRWAGDVRGRDAELPPVRPAFVARIEGGVDAFALVGDCPVAVGGDDLSRTALARGRRADGILGARRKPDRGFAAEAPPTGSRQMPRSKIRRRIERSNGRQGAKYRLPLLGLPRLMPRRCMLSGLPEPTTFTLRLGGQELRCGTARQRDVGDQGPGRSRCGNRAGTRFWCRFVAVSPSCCRFGCRFGVRKGGAIGNRAEGICPVNAGDWAV